MKYADPRENPHQWLTAILLDLLKQNTEESRKLLADAIRATVIWVDPGSIQDLFWNWIDSYVEVLDEAQSNQNNVDQQCSPEDQKASPPECQIDPKPDHPDTEADTK